MRFDWSDQEWAAIEPHLLIKTRIVYFLSIALSSRLTARQPTQREELAQDIGRSRGGHTSKVHAVGDESGRPRHLIITDGQVHHSQVMIDLFNDAGKSKAVVADKAYNSAAIRQHIAGQGALAVIPTKSNARKNPSRQAPLSHA